ncbi:M23 family metallopeptidase [Gleimia hominis]|uniref:M23 family metallopeptidase n=1 Tax=Gleimia hominis TaxID=595468 RepID=UPI0011AEC57B|nr:M23 family metallopeptidase [Gleimia hominis]WIK64809.1 M23 family metallopeptidase [Gleimia hominis]
MNSTSTQCPLPTRAQRRKQRKREQCSKQCSHANRIVRAGAVTVLAAATVAIPVSGFVGPNSSITLPSKQFAVAAAGDSWAGQPDSTVEQADDLHRSETASSRARVRTPLQVSQCMKLDSANGDRPVTQTAELIWPLAQGSFNFASPFGMRFHPVLGISRLHAGADLAAPAGTPIFAVADGVVVDSQPMEGAGYWVRIKHESTDGGVYYSGYAHMFPTDVKVQKGDSVKVGQEIALVGNNGMSTGPHLHFEIHDSADTPIDPVDWLKEQQATYAGEDCK